MENKNADTLALALIERLKSIEPSNRVFLLLVFKDIALHFRIIQAPVIENYSNEVLTISGYNSNYNGAMKLKIATLSLIDFLVIGYSEDSYLINNPHKTYFMPNP